MSPIGETELLLHQLAQEPLAILASKAQEIQGALPKLYDGTLTEAELGSILGGHGSRAGGIEAPASGEGVALIPLRGVIRQRGFWGASLETFMGHMEEAAADEDIGTIVVVGDTPGGSVSGVFEASDRIYELREKKRIIFVADPLLASAGYALASAGHEVVASPTSRTGSIGVISIFAEFSQMLEKAGISVEIFTFGKYKGEGNPYEPLSDEAREHLQETVNDYGELFVATVARNRDVEPEAVINGMGEARALTAERAVESGLADRVATLDDVLAELGVRRRTPGEMRGLMAVSGAAHVSAAAQDDDEIPVEDGDEDETEETNESDAAADATGNHEPADLAPEGEEERMAKELNANEPQDGAGTATAEPSTDSVRKAESKRATDIVALAVAHGMSEKATEWIEAGYSADRVGREILRLKQEEAEPVATPAQPAEERAETQGAPAKIRRRFSSREEEPGFELGMRLLAMAAVKNAAVDGKRLNAETFLTDSGYPEIGAAMRSDRQDAGGAWVPENYLAGEFIELLRPRSAVRMLNPRYLPLEGGNASIPKLTGGATAYYKGEAQRGTKSEGTSGRVNLVGKELMAFVPITAQLLRRARPDAAMTVRDDALAAVAQRSDLAFIRGDGSEDTPKGMRYLAASGNVVNANATVNLANVTTDLGKLVLKLQEADVRMIRPGWIWAPRTLHYLMTVRDGNGNYAFRDELMNGTFWGYPFASTSQIPTNLSGDGDESEVYFADFADVIVGEEEGLQFDAFDQVTYWDGSQWVSAAQNNEIVIRVIAEHDINTRYAESIAVLDQVTWGA